MNKEGYTYMITNLSGSVLYTGVTSDLKGRIWEHRNKVDPKSFSARYNCVILVWYEVHADMETAIAREKQLKAGSRGYKNRLVSSMNPAREDLWRIVEEW